MLLDSALCFLHLFQHRRGAWADRESLGSLWSQRGQTRRLLCSPFPLPLCLSHIQEMAENWPLTEELGYWECFLFILSPLEPLRRKLGSKTQT